MGSDMPTDGYCLPRVFHVYSCLEGYGCQYNHSLLYIVLMDVEMPGRDGTSTIEAMGSSSLQSAVVMLNVSDDVHTRVQAKEQQGFWRGVGRERCYERRSLKPRSSQARRKHACSDRSRRAPNDGAWRKEKMMSHITLTDIHESTRLVETTANGIEALSGYSEDEIVSLLWLRQHYQSGGSDRAAFCTSRQQRGSVCVALCRQLPSTDRLSDWKGSARDLQENRTAGP